VVECHVEFLFVEAQSSVACELSLDASKSIGHRRIVLASAGLANFLLPETRLEFDARAIFEYFKFAEFIGQLNDANLLYKVVQKVRTINLSVQAVSNHDMGLVFEELIRRFAGSSNETAGEHFTPRDIVWLTTALVFMEDDEALTEPGIIRKIYDPTAGTGGFLSSGMEYVRELNPDAVVVPYGQELNPESYAICKADMLITGQDVSTIKLGNKLSKDQLYGDKIDYMLPNLPFGVDWKKIEQDSRLIRQSTSGSFQGRFTDASFCRFIGGEPNSTSARMFRYAATADSISCRALDKVSACWTAFSYAAICCSISSSCCVSSSLAAVRSVAALVAMRSAYSCKAIVESSQSLPALALSAIAADSKVFLIVCKSNFPWSKL
jgi:hypothetical protein